MRVIGILAAAFVVAGCASEETKPQRPEDLVPPSQPVSCPAPVMPEAVTRAHLAGSTEVQIEVTPKGEVTDVKVTRASGSTPAHAAADAAVVAAERQCRFPEVGGQGSRTGVLTINWKG